jgi:hypothetical protein
MVSRRVEIPGGYHLKNSRRPPGFITKLQPAVLGPADSAVGWTAVGGGAAAARLGWRGAGVQEKDRTADARCVLLLS